ncbi:MAG: hypothetical protein A2161_21085 [Candidatus Schekmanbacteria bacterium RBG_13_48_7]|uniref:Phosphohydrolase n=1 Tax=Candidatus Schekmanbacteria bacterium RBG_13_48_7 TaxID=1817878 RepID=A0A1F7RLJ6_9BACT|nr:MAG: hypothetical protein A2161_21085 [Candidatus Schekmanbacteria bacterium RBG_13_48_7]
MKCPGQDASNWKPEDIYELDCPVCGYSVEFFKDDRWRKCVKCGFCIKNPRVTQGCAEWCSQSGSCKNG